MSNPSCLPSDREKLDSLQKSYKNLQKLYKEENAMRSELENEIRSNASKHQIEIELLEKNRTFRKFLLGKFSSIYSLGFLCRQKSQIK